MAVTVKWVGANADAVGSGARVSDSTLIAVSSSELNRAHRAVAKCPLVPAGAVATSVRVSSDSIGMISAVILSRTSQVAARVSVIASNTRSTVFG